MCVGVRGGVVTTRPSIIFANVGVGLKFIQRAPPPDFSPPDFSTHDRDYFFLPGVFLPLGC